MTDIKSVGVIDQTLEHKAREFTMLVFPRISSEMATNIEFQVQQMRQLKSASKKGDDWEFNRELSNAENTLHRLISSETQEEVVSVISKRLAEVLTVEELDYAIFQEKVTIKIAGIADTFGAIFEEAVREGNPNGGLLENNTRAVEPNLPSGS